MKITLHLPDDLGDRAVASDSHGPSAEVDGSCPYCGARPFQISGRNMVVKSHSYESAGYCVACHYYVGIIEAEPGTIFGIEEDERVLSGPWKVY